LWAGEIRREGNAFLIIHFQRIYEERDKRYLFNDNFIIIK
jgi:hypothetical protein